MSTGEPPKTDSQIVTDALVSTLRDLWYEENPHCDTDTHAFAFQRFCESVLYATLKKGV